MDWLTIGNYAGLILGGGGALVLGIQKALTKFYGDGITLTTTTSMGDMVALLSTQIKDLAATNVELRTEIKALRDSNSQLIIQNLHLQEEVNKLSTKVQALTTQ